MYIEVYAFAVTGRYDPADEVAREAVRRGIMMFTTGRGFLKITPPLCIDPDAAIEAVYVIRDCMRDQITQKGYTP